MILTDHINRVFRNFHHQVLVRDEGLATQARVRVQAPRLVEQVILVFIGLVQRIGALPDIDVAGGTGTGLLTGMLDLDAAF